MGKHDTQVEDRYVSFMNIDCYKHASEVIDCILEVTKNPKYNNPFWEAFKAKIPQAYYDKAPDEKVLYLVCLVVMEKDYYGRKQRQKQRGTKR